jgi:hypothetical protein
MCSIVVFTRSRCTPQRLIDDRELARALPSNALQHHMLTPGERFVGVSIHFNKSLGPGAVGMEVLGLNRRFGSW